VRLRYLEDMKASILPYQMVFAALMLLLPARWLYRLFSKTHHHLDDAAAILFSSGSEGKPKGVVLSHRNIIANCVQVSDVLNTRSDDVIVGSLPLFHSFGLTVTSFMPLLEGIPVVCHPDPYRCARHRQSHCASQSHRAVRHFHFLAPVCAQSPKFIR
jgi:acyl-[acyl-carrier-protein]-phospholipid O-acyltransferase/long-chain-fatty-acid--[acyl-carrier-protein] ligase